MLNLNDLEKSLDEALAQETKESLTAWLMLLRYPNLETFFGVGNWEELNGSYCINLPPFQETNMRGEEEISDEYSTAMSIAA